jgi:hypothetical protein
VYTHCEFAIHTGSSLICGHSFHFHFNIPWWQFTFIITILIPLSQSRCHHLLSHKSSCCTWLNTADFNYGSKYRKNTAGSTLYTACSDRACVTHSKLMPQLSSDARLRTRLLRPASAAQHAVNIRNHVMGWPPQRQLRAAPLGGEAMQLTGVACSTDCSDATAESPASKSWIQLSDQYGDWRAPQRGVNPRLIRMSERHKVGCKRWTQQPSYNHWHHPQQHTTAMVEKLALSTTGPDNTCALPLPLVPMLVLGLLHVARAVAVPQRLDQCQPRCDLEHKVWMHRPGVDAQMPRPWMAAALTNHHHNTPAVGRMVSSRWWQPGTAVPAHPTCETIVRVGDSYLHETARGVARQITRWYSGFALYAADVWPCHLHAGACRQSGRRPGYKYLRKYIRGKYTR